MYTPIKLDKTRNFRYGMKAISLIEKSFGKNISAVDFGNLTVEETITIMWAGLIHEDKDLTVEKLFDIIDEHNIKLQTITEAIWATIDDAFGKGEGENPNQAASE